jgi:polysaccharide lyase-like protein
MLSTRVLAALVPLTLGCAGGTTEHASLGRVLRLLTGDATTIRADGSAREKGIDYTTVKDGTPELPAITTEHAFGTAGIAFTVPTDPSGHKQRIEYKLARAADADGLHFDNARYAGFAFMLPASSAPFQSSAILWQAWQGYPFGPPVSLKLTADSAPPYRMKLAIRNAATGPDSATPDVEVWSDSIIQPGAWHTFLVYVEPRPGGRGRLKLWIDAQKVVDWTGAIGYDPKHVPGAYDGLDVKIGIYQPDANLGHTFVFDAIVVTTSYAAAAATLGWPVTGGR